VEDLLEPITRAVADLGLEAITPLLQRALARGLEAPALLEAMNAGMITVGRRFEEGEYFLADLVLAGETMKEGLKIIEPHFEVPRGGAERGVVLCTVRGDVHDIGKNLVGTMLRSANFAVIDLGKDVAPDRVVEAVRRTGARALGLSVLLTPMVSSVAEVLSALEAAGLRRRVRVAIGGACTTPELGQRLGVEAVGRDPIEAIRIFQSFVDQRDPR
jgi:methanogenic corrinoid protein MtbC1